ncbi:conserved telomere maintenance component 1 [Zea mays]|uniref:CST complex subunit CTC1 n=1 Tax=Zea mays TaxID=4577 RepID=A0A1D6I3G6_MAIZE|nr:conserved telomere maintenance component 1 [Zea mays]
MEASAPAPPRFTVADLLRLRRPTTGASSLLCLSVPTSTSTSRPRKKHKLSAPVPTWSTGTVPFAPMSHPVLLSGTLSLPSASSPISCRSNCFSFSDPCPTAASPATAAASVCCCILDFDPAALGRVIRVLAWNYLPSLRLHAEPGVLEVVRWHLEESAPPVKYSFLATVPFRFPDQEPDLATRGCAFGLVRSVSIVFSMPLAKADAGSRNSVGFLAEILCCGCRRCCRATPPEDAQTHMFETMKFVYFVDASSMWRPVLVWLVGRLVYISGLSKKMVSVGDKASHTILVSSAKTTMAWCPSYRGSLPLDNLPEKCGGEYAGVITGIYSQGLVVELDDTAWLLIDDQKLLPPHSLRVGAIVSVKNFRAVCLNFAWTRVVLLATCSKTCITVNCFSLVDSKIHLKTDNKGLLGTFVDSLEMPARFWMLLLISCFKQKFTKLFSDKEILGSQNKQGLVHAYATKILTSKCQPQASLVVVHNCSSLSLGSKLEACKLVLVVPFSNLVCKCESLWILSMLKLWNGSEKVGKSQVKLPFYLMSVYIKQLLSCFHFAIQIVNYKLALEGPMAYIDHYDVADALSCKAVFQKLPYKKRLHHLNIYVIVQWRQLIHIGPSSCIPSYINYRIRLFHLLKLSHIFPVNSNIQCSNMPGSSLYAEAVILPYVLKFIGQGEFLEHAEGFIMSHSTLLGNSEASVAKSCNIPCSLSFGSTNLCGTLVSTYASGSEGTVLNEPIVLRKEYSRILLEFEAGIFKKYQLPRINGSYILQCPSRSFTCTMGNCGCLQGGKVSIDAQDRLWSFAITIGGNINIKGSIGDQSIGVTSMKMDEIFSRNMVDDELRLVQPWNDFYRNSYFHLDFSYEAISKKMEDYNTVCHVLNGLCVSSSEVLSVSSCVDIMMPKDASVSADFKTKEVVHGDLLISVQGKVENIHSLVCKWERCIPGNEKYSLCIHIADNNHAVYIRGYSNKHFTVGIGPGATVTFHRIRFKQFAPSLLVATILVLVLNKSTNQGETPNVKVRLAGFILDDGSSLCCGWADDARAELLLRLQEIVHLDASVNLKLSKGGENSTKLKYTIGCCLEKMLKQHTSVTNVMASALSPDDINGFNVELPVPVQNMRMLWIEEVFPVDPLEEARRLHDILENS